MWPLEHTEGKTFMTDDERQTTQAGQQTQHDHNSSGEQKIPKAKSYDRSTCISTVSSCFNPHALVNGALTHVCDTLSH